ncbi:MAG: hypothetical protein P1P64_03535 [Treponemataceae bacterium]
MKKFIFFSLVLCLVLACPSPVSDSKASPVSESDSKASATEETPLPLTVENLAGKWSRENSSEAIEFTADYKYIGAKGTTDGSYKIISDEKIEVTYQLPPPLPRQTYNVKITLYKNYLLWDLERGGTVSKYFRL